MQPHKCEKQQLLRYYNTLISRFSNTQTVWNIDVKFHILVEDFCNFVGTRIFERYLGNGYYNVFNRDKISYESGFNNTASYSNSATQECHVSISENSLVSTFMCQIPF